MTHIEYKKRNEIETAIAGLEARGFRRGLMSEPQEYEYLADGPHEIDPLTHETGFTLRWNDPNQ